MSDVSRYVPTNISLQGGSNLSIICSNRGTPSRCCIPQTMKRPSRVLLARKRIVYGGALFLCITKKWSKIMIGRPQVSSLLLFWCIHVLQLPPSNLDGNFICRATPVLIVRFKRSPFCVRSWNPSLALSKGRSHCPNMSGPNNSFTPAMVEAIIQENYQKYIQPPFSQL